VRLVVLFLILNTEEKVSLVQVVPRLMFIRVVRPLRVRVGVLVVLVPTVETHTACIKLIPLFQERPMQLWLVRPDLLGLVGLVGVDQFLTGEV
jgi:hypothetical protein